MITDLDPGENFGKHPYFAATFLSEDVLAVMRTTRSLVRFSLTGLPKSARIERVILTLFYDLPVPWDCYPCDSIRYLGDPSTGEFAWFGAVLQQVVEPWEEHEVTWEKQPGTIEANQVYISPFVKNANLLSVKTSIICMTV